MSGFSGPVVPQLQLPRRASRFYPTHSGFSVTTIAIAAADTLYVSPFAVLAHQPVNTLSIRVITGGAGSAFKAALWANQGALPIGAPLAVNNTGGATTSNNTNVSLDVTDIALEPGIYWQGVKFTGTMPAILGIHVSDFDKTCLLGAAAIVSGGISALQLAATYANDMPTFTGAEGWADFASNGVPIMWLGT